jgi:hypothetical protein
LSVFVKRDRSACAVEGGDDKEEESAEKPSDIRGVECAVSVSVEVDDGDGGDNGEDTRRADGRRK